MGSPSGRGQSHLSLQDASEPGIISGTDEHGRQRTGSADDTNDEPGQNHRRAASDESEGRITFIHGNHDRRGKLSVVSPQEYLPNPVTIKN